MLLAVLSFFFVPLYRMSEKRQSKQHAAVWTFVALVVVASCSLSTHNFSGKCSRGEYTNPREESSSSEDEDLERGQKVSHQPSTACRLSGVVVEAKVDVSRW